MMRFFTRILHVFAISILFVKGKVDETGYVEIPQGKLQGIVKPNHIAFHGIPYAQPPVGPERWRKTKPGANWSGIKDVTDTNLVQTCIQNTDLNYPRPVSEDCLYLHIYMPRVNHLVRPGTNTYVPRSVMFWIHGGAFTRGSGSLSLYDGQHMVEQSGAIVVTVNYRLGGFGFMYDDDFESVPGNQGMWDIIEALKWVKSNIHHFYGDPDSITVFGESAGGQATSVLLALKEVENRQNLFRNAIVQSAPIGIPFRNKQQAIDLSHHFLEDLGCFNFTKTVDRWDCAREKSVDEINIVLRRMKPDPIDDIGDIANI